MESFGVVGFNISLRYIFKPSYSRNSLNTKRCQPFADNEDNQNNVYFFHELFFNFFFEFGDFTI